MSLEIKPVSTCKYDELSLGEIMLRPTGKGFERVPGPIRRPIVILVDGGEDVGEGRTGGEQGHGGVHHLGVDAITVADAKRPAGADQHGVGGLVGCETADLAGGGGVPGFQGVRAVGLEELYPLADAAVGYAERGGDALLQGALAGVGVGGGELAVTSDGFESLGVFRVGTGG